LAQQAVEFVPFQGGGFVRFGVAEEDTESAAVNGGGHGEYFTVNRETLKVSFGIEFISQRDFCPEVMFGLR